MRPIRPILAVTLAGVAVTGCSPNWQPVTSAQPRVLDPGQVVEFRRMDAVVRLHGVQFTPDSIRGIPWLDHLSCDTCRVSYALAEISQTRTGNPGAGAWWLLGPFIAVMGVGIGLVIAFSGWGGS